MGDLGLQGAYASSAIQQLLRQRIAEQLAARQQAFQNDLALRGANRADQTLELQAEEHRLNRARQIQQERDTAAAQVPLAMGDTIDQPAFQQTFAGTSTAPLFNQQTTLPATQIAGGATAPALKGRLLSAGEAGDQEGAASQGSAQVSSAPITTTGRLQYIGTPKQREEAELKTKQDRLLASPTLNPRERTAIEMETAGLKVPPGMYEPKPAHVGDGNFTLPGVGPIVGVKTPDGRITYRGQDVTDQVKPYVAPPTATATDSRLDRSYQYHRTALDKLAKPLEDQQQRMGRLIETLNQGSPQADALVAPELLTVMAGGQGSGLRMNEAEISRVVGGRSKWESLKAAMQQWALDPAKANSITPEQRAQMRALVSAVHEKSQHALGIVNEAGDRLIDAPDVMSHRQVISNARKQLQQLYEVGNGTPAPGGGEPVPMIAPDGRQLMVPPEKVAEMEAHGAKRR